MKAANREPYPDPVLDSLHAEPVRLIRPARQTIPFVFAAPHAGRLYPEGFLEASRLGPVALRRSEDAFVDELFSVATALGAPMLIARFPRAFIDANRAVCELDSAMFREPLPFPVDRASPRVQAGLGLIPRLVREGAEIYRTKLAAHDAMDRITRLYRPYHAALDGLAQETRRRFGRTFVVDCHSMPSAAAGAEIVLGDRLGLSAAPAVTLAAERAFEAQGFAVARNAPYAGGYTTQLHGCPAEASNAIQIEVNRSLYMVEDRIERGPRFSEIQGRIAAALAAFVAEADAPCVPSSMLAAE
ncbi:MAG TPA: N-formylglutamate amidohydrolase [Rhizomicrobium sp.]|jgi:N-formylglutamate deformylase